jgi:hypothetical protein
MNLRREKIRDRVSNVISTDSGKTSSNFPLTVRPNRAGRPEPLPAYCRVRPNRKKAHPGNPRAAERGSILRCGVIGSALAFVLAGCGTAPFDAPVSKSGYPTVRQVIRKINCEIADARDDHTINSNSATMHFENQKEAIAPFNNWIASVTLSLTVSDTEGLMPTTNGLALSFVDTLKSAGNSFGFAGSPIFYQQRSRTYTQTYTINIVDIDQDKENCRRTKWRNDFNLEGDLGIRDQIYTGLNSFLRDETDDYDPAAKGTPNPAPSASPAGGGTQSSSSADNFGATVSFDVFKGITSLGPSFTLVTFKGPTGGVGMQRDDMHKLIITFKPVPLPTPTDSKWHKLRSGEQMTQAIAKLIQYDIDHPPNCPPPTPAKPKKPPLLRGSYIEQPEAPPPPPKVNCPMMMSGMGQAVSPMSPMSYIRYQANADNGLLVQRQLLNSIAQAINRP